MSIRLPDWTPLVEDHLATGEPIVNLAGDGEGVYDAIFVGGGAAGRFGSSYLKAMGGRPLVIDRWPFLGGSCPHQACLPHHLFSEAAALLDRERWLAGQLWFRPAGEVKASILELVELFRRGRVAGHAFMNWQTKTQLGVEYLLNTSAQCRPAPCRRAGAFRPATSCSARRWQKPIDRPSAPRRPAGLHDFARWSRPWTMNRAGA
jgi:dihydrolipoamide dehydrogenase